MTDYKYDEYIAKSNSDEFDKLWKPGESCPHSGIYRCEACGRTAACNLGDPLPPQNHHQHDSTQGRIQWRMIVWA